MSHNTLVPLLQAELSDQDTNIVSKLLKNFDENSDGDVTRDELDALIEHLEDRFKRYDLSKQEMCYILRGLIWVVIQQTSVDSTEYKVSFKKLLVEAKKRGVGSETIKMMASALYKAESSGDFAASGQEIWSFLEYIRNDTQNHARNWEASTGRLLRGIEKFAHAYVSLRVEDDFAGVSHRAMLKALAGCNPRNIDLMAEAMLTYDLDKGGTINSAYELECVLRFMGRSTRVEQSSDFIAGINVAFAKLSSKPCPNPSKGCGE